MKTKYYAIKQSMTFEKTVLVPANCVNSLEEAIDLVNESIHIDLFNEEAEFDTQPSPYANTEGIYELSEEDTDGYQIIGNELDLEK